MPSPWRPGLYRQARRLRGRLWRLIHVLLHPRRALTRILSRTNSAPPASLGFGLQVLVLLDADPFGAQCTSLQVLGPNVTCWQLPPGLVDLATVLRQARTLDAGYVLFLANPHRLSQALLEGLARLVSLNPGFDAWLTGSTIGFWSWDFSGFSSDPEAILLVRSSLLELENLLPRTRRSAARLLTIPRHELSLPASISGTSGLKKASQISLLPLVEALPLARPRIHASALEERLAVVIPTRDRSELLLQAVEGLQLQQLPYPLELVVVDNGSEEDATQVAFDKLSTGSIPFKLIRDPQPFNFSALCNVGVEVSSAPFILLLNNDVVFTAPNSLVSMLELVALETVGCVGALLRYPDGKLQHMGVELSGELVQHQFYCQPLATGDFFTRPRQVAAVTGACVVFKRSLWHELGGLDEKLPVDFNDIDFCLRAQSAGFANLIAPAAQAIHLESASRGRQVHPTFSASLELMKARWGKQVGNDPFAISS